MQERRDRAIDLSVLVTSVALLALEVAELRVFSYSLNPLLVFCAISVALLGLGTGGIAIALRPDWARGDIRRRLVFALAGFSTATLLAHALFARGSHALGFGSGSLLAAIPLLLVLVLPYFFGGLFLSLVMARRSFEIGRIYFFNLLGSGIGCALVYPLLRPFGVEAIIAGCAALVALMAVWLAFPLRRAERALSLLVAAASLIALPAAERLFPFQPDPQDLLGIARAALHEESPGQEPRREHASWDPVSRVEVYDFPGRLGKVNEGSPLRFFVQDGGAGSALFDLRSHEDLSRTLFEGTVYGAGYMLRPETERVLIIGLGGAPDVHAALHFGAKEIVGVEINQSTIDVVGDAYADFVGSPYSHPDVTIIHGDGRSFVERSQERFDLIQMSGTDTLAAAASGAFMFSESYLYTVEAFHRYWELLDDDGVLAIIRFLLEPARIATTGIQVLRDLGVPHPERHFVVLQQGISVSVLLSKRELGSLDVERIQAAVSHANGSVDRLRMPLYDVIGFGFDTPIELLYAPGIPIPGPFEDLFQATSQHREQAFLAALPVDVTPVTDDRPFFFQFFSLEHLGPMLANPHANAIVGGFLAHLQFLLVLGAIAGALIVLPVALRRKNSAFLSRKASTGRGGMLVYFGALGFGYLFVELTLMQKTALFLGHPTYSIATTLLSLLVASGLGSLYASRWAAKWPRLVPMACLAVIALLLLEHLVLRHVFTALLPSPFPVRLLVVALAMFPLGFVMGMPFPLGLRLISARGEDTVAWALAINGFASVLASLVCVPIAMFGGFGSVVAIAAVLYAAAAIVAPSVAGAEVAPAT